MLFALWNHTVGCDKCIVMHQCDGTPKVWMCADSNVRCPTDDSPLAPDMEYKPNHAGCGCPYCQTNVGFCAGNDLEQGMQDFAKMKEVIEAERQKVIEKVT